MSKTLTGKAMVRPISYLRTGDVVLAHAQRDGELASPLTVARLERDEEGDCRIVWAGGSFGAWERRGELFVFLRP